MTLTIAPEDPLSADGRALIDGSEAALREVYRADECFTFSAAELATPDVTFFVARDNGVPVGELKRLFVRPSARGTGAGRALMAQAERHARTLGHRVIRLETGPRLAAGVALYRLLGYKERGSFGDYQDHPASLFMEKSL